MTGVEWLEIVVEACMLVVVVLLEPLLKFGAAVETNCAGGCCASIDRLAIPPLKLLPELGAMGRTMWGGTLLGIVDGMESAAAVVRELAGPTLYAPILVSAVPEPALLP